MIEIWAYNLTTFTYQRVEVDYIKEGKVKQAVKSREKKEDGWIDRCSVCEGGKKSCKCGYNTQVFVKFELTEELAKQRIKDYLAKEIKTRLKRVHKLIEKHNEYEEDIFKRFIMQPIADI